MANKIQIKRGLQANLPTLDVGEPALTTNSGSEKVYIGTGSGNKEMPTLVGGVLPVTKGGTGQSTLALTRNAMGLGNTTGALPVTNGGTGTTTLALARNAMGLGNTTGALPLANGGTASTTASGAKTNIGLGNVLNYGLATQAEAEAGTSNAKYMTPLRVKEYVTPLTVIGQYLGDGVVNRTIVLGFQPRAVFVINNLGQVYNYNNKNNGGLALVGSPVVGQQGNSVTITSTGFIVTYVYADSRSSATNSSGGIYHYIAFR